MNFTAIEREEDMNEIIQVKAAEIIDKELLDFIDGGSEERGLGDAIVNIIEDIVFTEVEKWRKEKYKTIREFTDTVREVYSEEILSEKLELDKWYRKAAVNPNKENERGISFEIVLETIKNSAVSITSEILSDAVSDISIKMAEMVFVAMCAIPAVGKLLFTVIAPEAIYDLRANNWERAKSIALPKITGYCLPLWLREKVTDDGLRDSLNRKRDN